MKRYDVCIIGGGAAGLAAAVSLDLGIKTCLLEKNEILGRKILATGGGRCNITNSACSRMTETRDFFKGIGLELYCDAEGRYYPYSNSAADVVTALTDALAERNTEIRTGTAVDGIERGKNGFILSAGGDRLAAEHVILAAGGKAAPQFGTTGDGYRLAEGLGHSIEKVYPILTGIECTDLEDVKGVRARGCVRLYRDGLFLAEERGEIQFTGDGISGICVMNLTLYIIAEPGEPVRDAWKRYHLELDLAPDFTRSELAGRKRSFGIVTEKLSHKVGPEALKAWKIPIVGIKGWRAAQCTAGGVSMDEVDRETGESKIQKGLYFAGEILNLQGPCGGFNLQNAWETGMDAAAAINRRYGRDREKRNKR